MERVEAAAVTSAVLEAWRTAGSLDASTRRILETALASQEAAKRETARIEELERERARHLAELERRRADLEALGRGGSRGEATKKTARRVEALEGELQAALAELERVGERREAHLEASGSALAQLPTRPGSERAEAP